MSKYEIKSLKDTTVTPEMAAKWLEAGPQLPGRCLVKAHLAYLVRAMKAGEWVLNGSSIKIDTKDDSVLDGRYRLLACIESGVSFPTCVSELLLIEE